MKSEYSAETRAERHASAAGAPSGRPASADRDRVLRLPDGRRLGYAVYGDAEGHPVVYAHGFPSSRLEAGIFEAEARRAGVAIIAPDRPGFGLSDFQPGRRIADWADDVADLVDGLGLQRMSLLGGSGGCPFTLACVERLGQRLVRVGIVAGLGPADPDAAKEMSLAARTGFTLARRAPRLFGALYGSLGLLVSRYPDLIFVLNTATEPDQAALEDRAVREILRAAAREAFRGGTAGPLHELRLISFPWGFEIGRLDAEVVLWQGSEDGVVPCRMARRLASDMPAADLRLVPGEGHISLPVRHAKEILAALLP